MQILSVNQVGDLEIQNEQKATSGINRFLTPAPILVTRAITTMDIIATIPESESSVKVFVGNVLFADPEKNYTINIIR